MSRKITVMFIPEKGTHSLTFSFSYFNMKFMAISCFVFSLFAGYICFDYTNLIIQRTHYYKIQKENKLIKSEAQILANNLESVKKALQHVQEYTRKINEMVNIKISSVTNKTGIGALSQEEFKSAQAHERATELVDSSYPLGLNLDKLTFNPIFANITEIQQESNVRAIELQQLLSSINQKKSILSSIPTILPAKGWITSGFGKRVSPFTGEVTEHRALDIAAALGTPIYAPADGVVIFSGTKPGFGNFIMIAHYENGIVTKYGHNAENLVTMGQRVSRGEQIASVGMTGNTTGPHVHYEVWVNGQAENPVNFILDAEMGLF